ncbi:MAG: hypothetical protein A2Z25_11440 [Planctomycetes bacterium RBG_16_55_9]|nr:MAG: hypothetical protein A2Z25_11440 [Planctomycetes bacterium RBG_16_55_9]
MMRVWTKVWIAVSLVCIGLTVYEIPDAVRITRFSFSMWRNRYTPAGKLNVPAIVTDKLIAEDPEAGDMLRYCLTYLRYLDENPNLEELAALAEKWPRSEFFISQLAEELTGESVVDPQAALVLVDKLLALHPENAHNQYLRGWIFLTDPNHTNHEQDALEEFEIGHRLPQFYLPYGKYKHRLDRLIDKANLIWSWEKPTPRPFYMDLARELFYSSGLRKRLDNGTFDDLSASSARIAERLIENANDSETLHTGATLLGLGEGIRLRELDLPEVEARQSRLRAAQGLALLDKYREVDDLKADTFFNAAWLVMAPLILFITLVPLVGIVVEFIQARFGRRKPRVREYAKLHIVIDVVLFLVLLLLVALEFQKKRPEGELPLFLFFMAAWFTSWSAIGLFDIIPFRFSHLRRPRLKIAVLCGSLWFKGTIFWTVGNLSIAMPGHLTDWLRYIGPLLFWSVLCVLVWIEAVYRPGAITTNRWNRSGLMAYWIVILTIFHVFGLAGVPMERAFTDPLTRYQPLPGATEQTYNRIILGQADDAASPEGGLSGRIYCAAPNDLRAFIAQRRAAKESISEQQLLKLLRNCNHDLRQIILAEFTDPNVYEVLVIRAEWGDRTVKEPLERIYQEKLTTFLQSEPEPAPYYPWSLGELLELAGTLARISDDTEAQERFSYLMEQVVEKTQNLGTGPDLDDPRYKNRIMQPFWESLGKLPPSQAGTLIKSYLRQTGFVDLSADRDRAIPFLADLLADGDRELAEEVVVALAGLPSAPEASDALTRESEQQRIFRLTRHRDKNAPPCLEAVFAHLTAESIPLLLEHLDSDNDQLRAFIVWRLTSLGYHWPREQLRELMKDPYWKVRLNALFALDKGGLANALDDENPVVRVIARFVVTP